MKCDFQLGIVPGVLSCTARPIYECACSRCTAEDDPFRTCEAHRADVNVRHAQVFPSRVVHWVKISP
jgi:hypothetical protein